jgi:sugar O-acyltransferase (sialic acid O-acetyltransferase NeuD family)
MTTPIVILGAGGFAREVLDVFDACNEQRPGSYDVLGFLSELPSDWQRTVNGKPVLGGFEWFERDPGRRGAQVICGIGNPGVRKRVTERCAALGLSFATVIHPRATCTRWLTLGEGTVVTAGVVLTNQIRIGRHVHLNLNCTIGHDAVLHDYVTVAPGVHVSGNVTVGEGCDLGTGAAVIQKVSIGAWSVVGAGAVVTKDLPDRVTAVGVPAKVIKSAGVAAPAGGQRG